MLLERPSTSQLFNGGVWIYFQRLIRNGSKGSTQKNECRLLFCIIYHHPFIPAPSYGVTWGLLKNFTSEAYSFSFKFELVLKSCKKHTLWGSGKIVIGWPRARPRGREKMAYDGKNESVGKAPPLSTTPVSPQGKEPLSINMKMNHSKCLRTFTTKDVELWTVSLYCL